MNICLFSPEELQSPLPPRDDRAQHLIKVLHKKAGDTFTAGIVGGMAGTAVITAIDGNGISFTFTPETDGKPLYPLHMIIGFPRPIQLKRLLRDMAGLGTASVHLSGTELGEKSYMQSTLVERGAAYKMLYDGTVQAGGTHVPDLCTYRTLSECLAGCSRAAGAERPDQTVLKIALDNIRPACALHQYAAQHPLDKAAAVIAAVGSERGWTDRERQELESAGFIRCGMGSRILRTETAATVAASIILDAMGKLS